MKKEITNKERFDILRGYYQGHKFYPKGELGVSLNDLLLQIGFQNRGDFLSWYNSLALEEKKEYKKDWCSGNCCQSILSTLLKFIKE